MRRLLIALIALTLLGVGVVLSVVLAPTAAGAGDRRAQLSAGEVLVWTIDVPKSTYPKVHVEGVVDAPVEVVWKLVTDCAGSQRLNSNVSKSRVVERVGSDVVCLEIIDMPWPVADLESVTRWMFLPGPPKWRREWTLVRGDFDYSDGSWTLEPFGDGTRTLAVYENHFSPKMSVPDWLTRAFLKVGMPGLVEDLRKAARAEPGM